MRKNLNDYFESVERKIGYEFENEDLLRQAFTRKSYSSIYGTENNEVLEFIGDKVIDLIVVKVISEYFGFYKSESAYYDEDNDLNEFCIVANKDESDFTDIKKELVSNENFSRIIDKLDFAKLMWMGDNDINNHIEKEKKVKADLLEAIVGAITIDCDWNIEILEGVICRLLNLDYALKNVSTEEERPEKFTVEKAINTLKELAEQGKCSEPIYEMSDEQVFQDGEYLWSCDCTVNSWHITESALFKSKKGAKKYAAYLVLCTRYNLDVEE